MERLFRQLALGDIDGYRERQDNRSFFIPDRDGVSIQPEWAPFEADHLEFERLGFPLEDLPCHGLERFTMFFGHQRIHAFALYLIGRFRFDHFQSRAVHPLQRPVCSNKLDSAGRRINDRLEEFPARSRLLLRALAPGDVPGTGCRLSGRAAHLRSAGPSPACLLGPGRGCGLVRGARCCSAALFRQLLLICHSPLQQDPDHNSRHCSYASADA